MTLPPRRRAWPDVAVESFGEHRFRGLRLRESELVRLELHPHRRVRSRRTGQLSVMTSQQLTLSFRCTRHDEPPELHRTPPARGELDQRFPGLGRHAIRSTMGAVDEDERRCPRWMHRREHDGDRRTRAEPDDSCSIDPHSIEHRPDVLAPILKCWQGASGHWVGRPVPCGSRTTTRANTARVRKNRAKDGTSHDDFTLVEPIRHEQDVLSSHTEDLIGDMKVAALRVVSLGFVQSTPCGLCIEVGLQTWAERLSASSGRCAVRRFHVAHRRR